jgi:D-3-phosphoglycerate dehydrogenase
VTHESRSNITRIAALAFAEAAHGRLPPRVINKEVVPRFAARWAETFGRPMTI